jgi:hypothetical protein
MTQVPLLSEPIAITSFFDELDKSAGIFGDAVKVLRARGTESYKALKGAATDAGLRELAEADKAKAEKAIEEKTQKLHGVHTILTKPSPKEQEALNVAAKKKSQRKLMTGFGLLGAGALGYSYHQYKKVADDQVTGVNYRPGYQPA